MSLLDILFTIAIRPLELLFELIFSLADSVVSNPAISLIVMSIAVNFLI